MTTNIDTHALKEQADILAIVGQFVELRHGQKNDAVGLCPFHNEKSPSFHVRADLGDFYCFGCAAKGDVIKFVELLEKIPFQAAAERVAKLAGLASAPKLAVSPTGQPARAGGKWGPHVPPNLLAESYGLTWADFEAAGFSMVDWPGRADWAVKMISYPVTYADGSTARKLKSTARRDGKRSQMTLPAGAPEAGLIGADDLDALFGQPLVIAGGEEKMLAARKAGYRCVCPQTGEKAPSQGACRMIAEAEPEYVIIAYDADEAGEKGTAAAVHALTAYGIKCKAIQWPDMADKGRDLNDVLLANGVEGVKNMLDNAIFGDLERPKHLHSKNGHTPQTAIPHEEISKLPDFPLEALPFWLRAFVLELTESMQVPPDLVATCALGCVSAALANKVKVRVRGEWSEFSNLYILAPMESGERKSQVVRRCIRPILHFEKAQRKAHASSERDKATKYTILKKQREIAFPHAAKGDPAAIDQIKRLDRDIEACSPSRFAEFLTTDATAEGLTSILSKNNGSAAIISDEGGILANTAGGLYSNGTANIDILLHGSSGGTIKNYRASRDTNGQDPWQTIYDATITCFISPQPGVLQDLASKPILAQKGFWARWLYTFPPPMAGKRKTWPREPDQPILDNYDRLITLLCELPRAHSGDHDLPWILRLSPEAEQILKAFLADTEPKLAQSGSLNHMKDWAGKMTGLIIKLAAILHATENCNADAWTYREITANTIADAIKIISYAVEHAKYAYSYLGTCSNSDERDAESVLSFLQKRSTPITGREIIRSLRKSIRPENIRSAIDALVDKKAIIEQRVETSGRPSFQYHVSADAK